MSLKLQRTLLNQKLDYNLSDFYKQSETVYFYEYPSDVLEMRKKLE